MTESGVQLGNQVVSRETVDQLQQLVDLLRKWSSGINLVSQTTLGDAWSRHIEDSAQVFAFRTPGVKAWVDLGSGAGFPGLVVSILAKQLEPDLQVTLVEADKRKSAFLSTAVRELHLSAKVLSSRVEDLPPLRADVVSARALAPLKKLFGYADRHLEPWGRGIFLKGKSVDDEIVAAKGEWMFEMSKHQSLTDTEASVLVVHSLRQR